MFVLDSKWRIAECAQYELHDAAVVKRVYFECILGAARSTCTKAHRAYLKEQCAYAGCTARKTTRQRLFAQSSNSSKTEFEQECDSNSLTAQIALYDEVCDELLQEKRKGWESEKVSKLWFRRTSSIERSDNAMPSYKTFYAYFRRTFPHLKKTVNGKEDRIFSERVQKTFLDVGCAPGGLCAYLTKDLGWSGVGLTLHPNDGGWPMQVNDAAVKIVYADITKYGAFDHIDQQFHDLGVCRFDYINLGVVISKCHLPSPSQADTLNMHVCRNSILILFHWLREGGDALWSFSSSDANRWFYFLKNLQTLFADPIRLLPTTAPSRSRVYSFCTNFRGFTLLNRLWYDELLFSQAISDAQLSLWQVNTWEAIADFVRLIKTDLHRLWSNQKVALEKIRVSAESGCADDRVLSFQPAGQNEIHGLLTNRTRKDLEDALGEVGRMRSIAQQEHDRGQGPNWREGEDECSSSKQASHRADSDQNWRSGMSDAGSIRSRVHHDSDSKSSRARADLDSNWRAGQNELSNRMINSKQSDCDTRLLDNRSANDHRNRSGASRADRDNDWRRPKSIPGGTAQQLAKQTQ